MAINKIITDIEDFDEVDIVLSTDSDYNSIMNSIDKGTMDINGLLASTVNESCDGCCDETIPYDDNFDNSVDMLDIDADTDREMDDSMDEDEENGDIIDSIIDDIEEEE